MKADILNLTKISYVVILGASIGNLAAGIIEPTVAPYLQILGCTSEEIGIIISARFLMVAIFSLPLALFASKFGLRRFLYFSAIFLGIAAYMISLGGKDGIYWFYLSIGIVSAIFNGPGTAILAENKGSKRIAAFSLLMATWMIPTAVGALISAFWFWGVDDYTPDGLASIFPLTIFVLVFGCLLFLFLLILVNKRKKKRNILVTGSSKYKVDSIPISKQFQILFAPIIALPLILLIFAQFLSGAGAGSSLPYLTPYLKSLDATPSELSMLVVILNVFMGFATQLTPFLAKTFGDLRVIAITTILSVVCLLGIILSDTLLISALFYILRGTFANMNNPISQARMFSFIDSRVRATGAATSSTVRWVGWSLFSPISGSIIDDHGYNVAFTFTSVIYIISLAIFLYAVSKFKSLEDKPTPD
ncbi:MAG: MFS transporter [Candidatus Heimdallarchaeota archaeon]|nr:MFS transporter [Candidatus Heimdallarchaeota archaeon]